MISFRTNNLVSIDTSLGRVSDTVPVLLGSAAGMVNWRVTKLDLGIQRYNKETKLVELEGEGKCDYYSEKTLTKMVNLLTLKTTLDYLKKRGGYSYD